MRILLGMCFVIIFSGCKVQEKVSLLDNNSFVKIINNVNVFTGQKYIENTNLVFNDSIIVAISENVASYKNFQTIDGKGKTIIPPLANAHVHLWYPDSLRSSLSTGIFANFDMHNTDHGSNYIRSSSNSAQHAKFYSSNAAATVPGGHGTQFGIPVPTINDTISPERFVQDRLKAGADYIKVIKEPKFNTLTDEQTLRVINEAHKNELLAVGHSHKIQETIVLVDQNIDGIVHIWFDKQADKMQLEKMKKGEVFLVPTMLVTKKVLNMGKSQGWSGLVLNFEEVLMEIKKAHDAGIKILCGTDAPNFGLNYTDSLFDEMDLLAQAGLPNLEVLKSATVNIYTSFQLDDFDELKSGTKANFLIIEGNPVNNLKDLRNSKKVYRNGSEI